MACEKEINAIILPYIGCLKPEQSARGFVECCFCFFFVRLKMDDLQILYGRGKIEMNVCAHQRTRRKEKQQLSPCAIVCMQLQFATKEKGNKL